MLQFLFFGQQNKCNTTSTLRFFARHWSDFIIHNNVLNCFNKFRRVKPKVTIECNIVFKWPALVVVQLFNWNLSGSLQNSLSLMLMYCWYKLVISVLSCCHMKSKSTFATAKTTFNRIILGVKGSQILGKL